MKITVQVTNGYDSKSVYDNWLLGKCVYFFFFQQGILRLHSTPQMGHAGTAVKESSASSIEQVYDMSSIILVYRYNFLYVCIHSIAQNIIQSLLLKEMTLY
jgi:hypothetical protein